MEIALYVEEIHTGAKEILFIIMQKSIGNIIIYRGGIEPLLRKMVPRPIKRWFVKQLVDDGYRLTRPEIDEIHIERIKSTKEELFDWIRKHPKTMLMPTLAPSIMNGDDFTEVLGLYKQLKYFPNKIGLHVHIRDGELYESPPQEQLWELAPLPSYEEQLVIIKMSLRFLENLGMQITDFASGNWNYNEDTFRVCKELNLTNVHIKSRIIPEITRRIGILQGISLVGVERHTHDFEIKVR